MTKLNALEKHAKPLRAGVFSLLTEADEAIHRLLAAGFTKDEITVVCSDESKERYFREFEHQDPAGTYTPAAAAIGSSIGAALGGITVAVGLATGGLPLIIIGGASMMTGAVLGGFLGAMATRGVEKEAANFYNQAVLAGQLLVVVECHGEDADARLARAERILSEAGAETEPVALAEG
jgi:hypothetical protein